MTDEQKLALIKGKFTQLIQASMQKDPHADTIFQSFFDAIKGNDAFFQALLDDRKTQLDQEELVITKRLDAITLEKSEIAATQPVEAQPLVDELTSS